jgi:Glycosyltransferase family 87
MAPAAVLAAAVHSAGDYGSGLPDDPGPTIAALVHGHLSAAAHDQPFIGLTSILLRLPFAAIATALGGGRMLTYRSGVFACALVLAVVVLAVVRRARVRPVVGLLIAVVTVLNPITVEWLNGHPEELLGGALCVAAVLAGIDDRPGLTGVLLGLAIATKQWALLAVLPSAVVCLRGRRRMLLIAAAVAAPLVFTLPVLDPTAFVRVSRGIGDLTWPSIRSWWWMVSGYQHVKLAHGLSTSVYLLPLGLTRTDVSLLPLLIAVPLGWLHVRGRPRPQDAMRLLALVLLLRCTLDPECGPYYYIPAIVALLAWEALDGRISLAALIAIAFFSLGEHEASTAATLGTAHLCWLAGTVGLTAYLLRDEFRLLTAARPRLVALAARTHRQRRPTATVPAPRPEP